MRPIEVRSTPDCPSPGVRPRLDWIPIDRILVDETYQRPLGEKNWRAIRRIARNFDWTRFEPIMLACRPDGTYALVDGQHRVHAAAAIGESRVPALIVNATPAEQAEAFTWINGNVTAMTVFHVYKAGLAAALPWALEMRSVVAAADCELMTYPMGQRHRRPRQVFSVGLVRKYVDAGRGASIVTRGLSALVAAGSDSADYYNDAALAPWLLQICDWPGLSVENLTGFLGRHDLLKLIRRAATLREDPRYRHDSVRAIVNMLLTRAFFKDFSKARK